MSALYCGDYLRLNIIISAMTSLIYIKYIKIPILNLNLTYKLINLTAQMNSI